MHLSASGGRQPTDGVRVPRPADRRPDVSLVEQLEDRTLLSVSAVFIQATGTLVVATDTSDDVTVAVGGSGEVLVNRASPQDYENQFGVPAETNGDTDGDGDLDFDDIDDFVAILTALGSAGIQNAPEPGTAALLCLGVGVSQHGWTSQPWHP